MVTPYRHEPFTDFTVEENRAAFQAALNQVEAELGQHHDLLVGGERIKTDETIVSINPANKEQVIGTVSKANRDIAEKAITPPTKRLNSGASGTRKPGPASCSVPRPSSAAGGTNLLRTSSKKRANRGKKPTPM